jgi:uncharacterized protein YegP (UPF0339 family)
MRFEYWKNAEGAWAWQLKTTLGDVLARGTPHPSRERCLTAIKEVKLAAAAACREVASPAEIDRDSLDDGLVPLQPEPISG